MYAENAASSSKSWLKNSTSRYPVPIAAKRPNAVTAEKFIPQRASLQKSAAETARPAAAANK